MRAEGDAECHGEGSVRVVIWVRLSMRLCDSFRVNASYCSKVSIFSDRLLELVTLSRTLAVG